MKSIKGNELPASLQLEVKRKFVHRCTGDHIPAWARRGSGSGPYRVQFKNDIEWLENTHFYVTDSGTLSLRHRYCESVPTWNGPLLK